MSKNKPHPKDGITLSEYTTTAEPKAYAGNVPVFCAHDAIVSIKDLRPNPKNPNQHPPEQIKALGAIIRATGWRGPITVSTRSGMIVKGHGRLMAAQLEDMTEVPVDFQSYASEAEELADLTADNRIAELAETDNKLLAELFANIDIGDIPVELTGYTEEEYNDIVSALSDAIDPAEVDEDEAPEVDESKPAITQPGDVWLLGRHRLMCGDSTVITDVEQLMDGRQADLLITDPPYNVDYTDKTKDALKIQNDKMEDNNFRQFLTDAFTCADAVMKPGAVFYIWHADLEGYNFRGACRDIGWKVRECLIWVKNTLVMGRQDYQWKHEPCLYGWKEGTHLWASDRKQTTTLNFDRPTKNDLHPTMKPVELFDYQIQNNTKGGDIVLDLFGGSGTTVAACVQNGRVAYCMELDPRYCDVIVKRYIRITGKKDVRCIRQGKELPMEAIAEIFEPDAEGSEQE